MARTADRVYCTTLDEGTGDLTLDETSFSAKWFLPPASLDGETVDYAVVHRTQNEVETGSCVYDHATTTLLRGVGTAHRSTAGEGVKATFSPGVKDVFLGFGGTTLNKVAAVGIVTDGATFVPTAVPLDRTREYDPLTLPASNTAFALAAVTEVPGAYITVQLTGVEGSTLTWSADFAEIQGGDLTLGDYAGFTGSRRLVIVWSAAQGKALVALSGSGMSAAEILAALITVDGTGSGLDADLLDGLHASAFATAAQGTTADAALPRAGGTMTGLLRLVGLIQDYASPHTHGSAGAVAPNLASGLVGAIRVTMNANGTSWAPTNVPTTTTARYPVTVRFIQGAAGGFTLDLSALDWGNVGAPSLGTTAGDWLEIMMVYDHGVLYPRYVDHRTA